MGANKYSAESKINKTKDASHKIMSKATGITLK